MDDKVQNSMKTLVLYETNGFDSFAQIILVIKLHYKLKSILPQQPKIIIYVIGNRD